MFAAFLASAIAQEKPAEPGNPQEMTSMMKDCPMSVRGVEIAMADITDGVALTITTKTGDVSDLRGRVQRMLAMHGILGKLETIDNGAKVNLTPKDPAELIEFRKQTREHVDRMTKGGGCEQMHQMMQGMAKGMMGGMGPAKSAPEPKSEIKKQDPEVDHNAHHPPEEKR
jgi:hypothetical protein